MAEADTTSAEFLANLSDTSGTVRSSKFCVSASLHESCLMGEASVDLVYAQRMTSLDRINLEKVRKDLSRGQLHHIVSHVCEHLRNESVLNYVLVMAAHIVEFHRMLRPTGNLVIRCGTDVERYLGVIADAVFGSHNFRNSVVWKNSYSYNGISERFAPCHDRFLIYGRSQEAHFTLRRVPVARGYVESAFKEGVRASSPTRTGRGTGSNALPWEPARMPGRIYDPGSYDRSWHIADSLLEGRPHASEWTAQEKLDFLDAAGLIMHPDGDGLPSYVQKAESTVDLGNPISDIWMWQPWTSKCLHMTDDPIDFDVRNSHGAVQRLLASLTTGRASVFLPFSTANSMQAVTDAGCSWTAVGRYAELEKFMARNERVRGTLPIKWDPATLKDILSFLKDDPRRKSVENWQLDRIGMPPNDRKSADGGVDSRLWLNGSLILAQAKSGTTSPKDVEAFGGHMTNTCKAAFGHEAAFGLFLLPNAPTKEMRKKASAIGQIDGRQRIQFFTFEDLLREAVPDIPEWQGRQSSSPG